MEATIKTGAVKCDVKEKLISLTEPKNSILARLQSTILGGKDDRVICSYSRMHNRHNRS